MPNATFGISRRPMSDPSAELSASDIKVSVPGAAGASHDIGIEDSDNSKTYKGWPDLLRHGGKRMPS